MSRKNKITYKEIYLATKQFLRSEMALLWAVIEEAEKGENELKWRFAGKRRHQTDKIIAKMNRFEQGLDLDEKESVLIGLLEIDEALKDETNPESEE